MTPEAQRIAIAEACGWKWVAEPYESRWEAPSGHRHYAASVLTKERAADEKLPDYLNDLNAMHEAEMTLNSRDQDQFEYKLQMVTGKAYPISATAVHRAEAFLRTIRKWEEKQT